MLDIFIIKELKELSAALEKMSWESFRVSEQGEWFPLTEGRFSGILGRYSWLWRWGGTRKRADPGHVQVLLSLESAAAPCLPSAAPWFHISEGSPGCAPAQVSALGLLDICIFFSFQGGKTLQGVECF